MRRSADRADELGSAHRADGWRAEADRTREAILHEGWNPRIGAFTQAFGSDDLDASALMLSLVGFLPPLDPRVRATADVIASSLVDDRGLVRRYLAGPDGYRLAGSEGSFLLCNFWLARVLALGDRVGEVRGIRGSHRARQRRRPARRGDRIRER